MDIRMPRWKKGGREDFLHPCDFVNNSATGLHSVIRLNGGPRHMFSSVPEFDPSLEQLPYARLSHKGRSNRHS